MVGLMQFFNLRDKLFPYPYLQSISSKITNFFFAYLLLPPQKKNVHTCLLINDITYERFWDPLDQYVKTRKSVL